MKTKNLTYTSLVQKLDDLNDLYDFVIQIFDLGCCKDDLKYKEKSDKIRKVFDDVVTPMAKQYLTDKSGKDYIAYNERNGFCFLTENQFVRTK
jgi:hypothetical protein